MSENLLRDTQRLWASMVTDEDAASTVSETAARGAAYAELALRGIATLSESGMEVVEEAHDELLGLAEADHDDDYAEDEE